ncbi:SGNH/GDSL hydrolase family protein [Arthrobacter sp. 135MFCol5.1]|uniref:SGNH/GDSL hydrolase family protein n=1 Tax=Arthrobacter sp. 135MFCol5.1 TaxID=1158050 RepID=UPI000686BAF6|nr:SGNH/GDSL hydrolase family protein [Arthrobacter sp. 135MFCol5.1]
MKSGITHLTSLGSSFAAGPGILPIEDRLARRSTLNYPHLLAEKLGCRLTDLSVSGATTDTILTRSQRVGLAKLQPQIRGLPHDSDLVTVTAGGNDVGYIGSMYAATLTGWLSKQPVISRLWSPQTSPKPEMLIDRATAGLVRVAEEIHRRAPMARVVFVDYFTIIGHETTPGPSTPFDSEAISMLGRIGEQVAQMFQNAADRSGSELVKLSQFSEDHALGSSEPWVNGFRPKPGNGISFHPNREGMQAAARLIEDHLGLL